MTDLVGELATRSDAFATRWLNNVRIHRTAIKRLHNAVVGDDTPPLLTAGAIARTCRSPRGRAEMSARLGRSAAVGAVCLASFSLSTSKETLVTRPGAATSPRDHAPAQRWGGDLVLPVGLGGNTFGRTTDADASHRILDAFADTGGVLVDTADTYSDGASEVILGNWMRDRKNRHEVVVSTKGGNHPPLEGLSATTVTAAAEESLSRLGTDYIDLYFAHYQDDQTPIEETAAAFDALVRAGKIRAIGLSNFNADAVREWIDTAVSNGFAAPAVLQPHFSLVHRQPFEAELAPLAREAGLAVLPYRALGGGFLSGKYRTEADTEDRARGAGVRPLLTPKDSACSTPLTRSPASITSGPPPSLSPG